MQQSFRELGVSSPIVDLLAARSIEAPFRIQALVLPDALAGLDILARAPTGSGKTLAFAVPIVERTTTADKRPSALVLVPTRELAGQVTTELKSLAATKGLVRKHGKVQLETALDDDLPIVHVDADRLMQVIVNLISNAVKFSNKEKAWVCLEAQREDGALRVNVRDNGIGIDKQDHRKIFERFQQAGNTLTDKPAGTGLGLPISREILRHFNGEIWVESELGKGAAFSFRIPAAGTRDALGTPPRATTLESV